MRKTARQPARTSARQPARALTLAAAALLLAILAAPLFAGPGPVDFAHALAAPDPAHWLGRDHFGQSLAINTAKGLQISLLIGVLTALGASLLGFAVGLAAASFGGRVDTALMRLTDAFSALPQIVIVIIIASLWRGSITAITLALIVTHWTTAARTTRAQALALRESRAVAAARNLGATPAYIARAHLAPAAAGQMLVSVTMLIPHAVWHESALSFLGLGMPPDRMSLGTLLNFAQGDVLTGAWHTLAVPAAALVFATLTLSALVRLAAPDTHAPAVADAPAPTRATTSANAAAPATAAPTSGLKLTALHVTTPAGREILSVPELALPAGQVCALVGASGSGKTTLLRALLGLNRGLTVTGQLTLPDADATRSATSDPAHTYNLADPAAPAHSIAPGAVAPAAAPSSATPAARTYNLADPAALAPLRGRVISAASQSAAAALTPARPVRTQLRHALRALRPELETPAARDEAAVKLLAEAGFPLSAAGHYPHELSGGMAARAALALALAGNPRVILADEPTAALDPELAAGTLRLLTNLAAAGRTVIVATHDFATLAAAPGANVAVLKAGELCEVTTLPRFFSAPAHPYTRELAAALTRLGITPAAASAETPAESTPATGGGERP